MAGKMQAPLAASQNRQLTVVTLTHMHTVHALLLFCCGIISVFTVRPALASSKVPCRSQPVP